MAQEQVREAAEDWYRYALALEVSQEGFWDWDLLADRLWGSKRWRAITGLDDASSRLTAWMELVHPHDKPRFEAELRALQAGKLARIHNEHRIRHKQGHWRWVLARGIAAQDYDGRVTHVVGSLTDNTEARIADPLTGLPNRIYFLDHLEQRLERARSNGRYDFAVLAVALERFDEVNETLGCSGGDRLLMEAAANLQAMLPGDSVAARLNGAEFLVCLEPVQDEAEAVRFAAETARAIPKPFVWFAHRVTPQLAVGVAKADASYAHPEDLMSAAESALTHARREEPSGVVCYSSGMRERAMEKLELEGELERAVRSGEMVLHYQPEVDLRTNRIIGFEALVRWNHPRRGLLPPSEFIPLAEETGAILPLGEWGLREACRQLVAWRNSGEAELREARMSVNLSARQLESPDLVDRVRRALVDTGLDPQSLRLEVTESSLISDTAAVQKTMRELGELGIGLHMDDFGVGYSSLFYLQRFPFDTLKIDRSFVQGLVHDHDSRQIVRSILDLAHSFGMDVVAEGIEDTRQLEELRKMGCPCGQGYYFARPMAPSAIEDLLHEHAGLNPHPALPN
jgi:diguanylate cyclase (GGDEF)-like protein/PAS domain S-box-containing protein